VRLQEALEFPRIYEVKKGVMPGEEKNKVFMKI